MRNIQIAFREWWVELCYPLDSLFTRTASWRHSFHEEGKSNSSSRETQVANLNLYVLPWTFKENTLDQMLLEHSEVRVIGQWKTAWVMFLVSRIWKISRGSIFGKERFISACGLRIQCIVAGKTWWQMCEEAGHVESAVRKHGAMTAGTQLVYCLSLSLRSWNDAPLL